MPARVGPFVGTIFEGGRDGDVFTRSQFTPQPRWRLWSRIHRDRIQVVSKAVKKLGGKIQGGWFAFGDSDVIAILDMPDNASMAAFALAIGAGERAAR